LRYYSSACPVLASTNGVAYEITITGCRQNCPGCHATHLHDFNEGKEITPALEDSIVDNIRSYLGRIDNICIIGGEPLDQDIVKLEAFLRRLRSEFEDLGMWLYTSYESKDIPDSILKLTDYIKCGRYEEGLLHPLGEGFKSIHGPTLATSNQYVVESKQVLKLRRRSSV